ncbi:PDDEXK nuclease domain-containing protein [Pseudocnuella soli]|uniref:PDDEXK nuclease domain-containing protein n=1 Tax=Pseudocnuella soli TaxID=2502779 RepID=UPI001052D663|nr:PDDEXK nuclease domain-containing protein [Pseudocnuella soli]
MKQPANYNEFVAQLKAEIQSARLEATLTANVHLLVLYWKMGKAIADREGSVGWGGKVVEQLASDLRSEFPDMKGISSRNLRYMREFANAYPLFLQPAVGAHRKDGNKILQVPLAKLSDAQKVQDPLAKITWYHHITLLDKVKDPEERLFYITETAVHGWSRNVLVHQIESGLYRRKGNAVTNFATTLPQPQSDLAKELMKDPYKFDFLSLGEAYKEKDLENALVEHITKFLLELGAGFSYVGRQYHLEVGGEDFYIDLLFYHLKLRCFVVIELKTGKFIPEYASKLNFYLNVVDDNLRHPTDGPSIGILICKERNKVIAEYALRGINRPIGVSEYELTENIPPSLKGKLPTVKEIEAELADKID